MYGGGPVYLRRHGRSGLSHCRHRCPLGQGNTFLHLHDLPFTNPFPFAHLVLPLHNFPLPTLLHGFLSQTRLCLTLVLRP